MVSKADLGIASAIKAFIIKEWKVSIPLNDAQNYDLVLDKEGILYKVQVKTASAVAPSGNYEVDLRTKGGTAGTEAYRLTETDVDLLYIITKTGEEYLIPIIDITSSRSITLGDKYKKFLL